MKKKFNGSILLCVSWLKKENIIMWYYTVHRMAQQGQNENARLRRYMLGKAVTAEAGPTAVWLMSYSKRITFRVLGSNVNV